MNDRIEDIFQKIQDVGLSTAEKSAMRQSLLEMTERRPAAAATEQPPVFANFLDQVRFWPRLLSRPALVSFLAGGMLLTGSGISYAAEGSLPGEPLYPVKVSVNEPVRGFLAISPKAKASWAAERVERRLEEVEVLVAASEIDPTAAAGLQHDIQDQARQAGGYIDRLAGSGDRAAAVAVGSKLEKRLQKHQDRLARMFRHRIGNERKPFTDLSEAVSEEGEYLVQKNAQNEGILAETAPELAVPLVADRLFDSEAKLREAREMLGGRDDQPDDSRRRVRQDLDQADGYLDEGKEAMKKGDLPKAFSKLREAYRRARAARELIEAGGGRGGDKEGTDAGVRDDGRKGGRGDEPGDSGRGEAGDRKNTGSRGRTGD